MMKKPDFSQWCLRTIALLLVWVCLGSVNSMAASTKAKPAAAKAKTTKTESIYFTDAAYEVSQLQNKIAADLMLNPQTSYVQSLQRFFDTRATLHPAYLNRMRWENIENTWKQAYLDFYTRHDTPMQNYQKKLEELAKKKQLYVPKKDVTDFEAGVKRYDALHRPIVDAAIEQTQMAYNVAQQYVNRPLPKTEAERQTLYRQIDQQMAQVNQMGQRIIELSKANAFDSPTVAECKFAERKDIADMDRNWLKELDALTQKVREEGLK